jgi:DNA-binding MarR family transcriptional regulator
MTTILRGLVDVVNYLCVPHNGANDVPDPIMPAHPDQEVLDLLNAVIHGVKAHMQRVLREDSDPITPMEMRALNWFARHPGSTQGELVQHSGRDKAQIARTISQLLEREMLARTEDEADRRCHRLSLTERGASVHKKVQKHRRQLDARLVQGFAAGERAQAVALLQRMQDNLLKEEGP